MERSTTLRRIAAMFVACGLVAAASGPGVAAEACDAARSANNPAFGPPRACATGPARSPSKTTPAGDGAATVTREGGKTVYRSGGTSIAVGGHVAADMIIGRTK